MKDRRRNGPLFISPVMAGILQDARVPLSLVMVLMETLEQVALVEQRD